MATITLNVPDEIMPRVITALCAAGNRPVDSPIPRGQFAREQVIRYVRHQVRAFEAEQAAITARQSAEARAETEVVIT